MIIRIVGILLMISMLVYIIVSTVVVIKTMYNEQQRFKLSKELKEEIAKLNKNIRYNNHGY